MRQSPAMLSVGPTLLNGLHNVEVIQHIVQATVIGHAVKKFANSFLGTQLSAPRSVTVQLYDTRNLSSRAQSC